MKPRNTATTDAVTGGGGVASDADGLPRLPARSTATTSNTGPKYLARLSWQRDLLETHDASVDGQLLYSLSSPSKSSPSGLRGSMSTPSLPSPAPWSVASSPSKPVAGPNATLTRLSSACTPLMSTTSKPPTGQSTTRVSETSSTSPSRQSPLKTRPDPSVAAYEEAMLEVEALLEEKVRTAQRLRAAKVKPLSTIQQSVERRDPAMSTFAFAPLRDPELLIETEGLRDEETDSAEDPIKSARLDVAEASSKYFGKDAKAAYYQTYQELHAKPHLFVEQRKKPSRGKSLKTSSALNTALDLRKSSILNSIAHSTAVPSSTDDPAGRRRAAIQPAQRSVISHSNATTTLSSCPSIHSPRVLFLSACIANSHPAISLVLRKENCHTFDLSHQSLGDEFIIQFAACLPDLPFVEAINVCDNRLSDNALNELLMALENKPNLTMLDISENEIGRMSAKSLRKYISSSLCTIKNLVLNDADIDDHECALFMIAFEQNKSVAQLLMKSNRIGQARRTMALGTAATTAATLPQDTDLSGAILPTGGEAIGSMLNVNLNIQELDLSWNMLRVSSCSPIASALQLNYNLRDLNLSYNGCGDQGAMVLANALRNNAALQKLQLAYNSVGPRGGLALASGLVVNKGLKELILDGNPIGLDSGRELMHAACTRIHTTAVCTLSMFECNLARTHHSSLPNPASSGSRDSGALGMNLYNPSDPAGKYALNLTDPYEHMIAHELLRLATFKRGYRFAKLEHSASGSTRRIELHRDSMRGSMQSPTLTPPDTGNPLKLLFNRIDKDGSGAVDASELSEALKMYGIHINDDLLTRVLHEYDYDNSGALAIDEFEDFFLRCGFAVIDTDRSGALNEKEIEKVLQLMGFEATSEREIRRMIAKYDLNNSGEIDEHEFIEFMKTEILRHQVSPAVGGEGIDSTASLEDSYEKTALRDPSGVIWKVPTCGILSVEFVYEADICEENGNEESATDNGVTFGKPHHLSSNGNHSSQLIASTAISKLLFNVQNISKNTVEQTEFFREVLEQSDLFFTAQQAEDVLKKQGSLKSWPRKLHGLERMLPQMISRTEALNLVNRVVEPSRQWEQRHSLRQVLGKFYPVLLGSITNRYRFDLHVSSDRLVLKKLAQIAQEEKMFSKNRSGRHDTSQNGNWENFRNAKIDGQAFLLTSTFIQNSLLSPVLPLTSAASMHPLQPKRFVEFDYVSTTRPPRGMQCISSRRFEQLLEVWLSSDYRVNMDHHQTMSNTLDQESRTNAQLRWEILRNYVRATSKAAVAAPAGRVKSTLDTIQQKIGTLEVLVSERWFSCEQVAVLIGILPNAILARARAASILFGRIVDLENFICIYDMLSSEDQQECVKRLGWLNIFDPTQPDRKYPPLDLSVRDERELVQLLSRIALKEGRGSWKRASYRATTTVSSAQNAMLPFDGWGNPDATGEESLKHHGLVQLQFESLEVPMESEHEGGVNMEYRLGLRSHVLSGTRLFLQ